MSEGYLPENLRVVPNETAVVGDVDAFMDYVEDGLALLDWHLRIASVAEECDSFLREHSRVWAHIIHSRGTTD